MTAGAKLDGGMRMADERSEEASTTHAITEETELLNKKGMDEAD